MQYALAMLVRGDEVQRWPIEIDEVIIGRSDKATVHVEGSTVSRQHARLWLEDGIVAVEDLGSRNGVKINGVRTRSGSLHDGDKLEVGKHLFVVTTPDAPPVSLNNDDAPEVKPNPEVRATQKRALQNPDVRLNSALGYAARLQPYLFDTESLFKHIGKIILSDVPAQRCYVLAQSPDKRDLSVLHSATRNGSDDGPGMNTTLIEHVYHNRKPVISGDVSEAPTTSNADAPKTGTICVPLMSGKNAIGVLYVDTGWESSRFVSANLEDMKAYGLAFGAIIDQVGQLDSKFDAARDEGVNEATSALGKCFYEQLHDLREAMKAGPEALDGALGRADLAVQQMIGIANISHAKPRQIPAKALVDKALAALDGDLASAGIRVNCQYDPRAVAYADAYQVERVLYALITQSISTCTNGKHTLSITTESKTDGCYFVIDDDGEGLPPGQVTGLSSSVLDNTMLGMRGIMLANAFGVVEAHSGRLIMKSEEGSGSTVTIVLPQQESAVVKS